MNKIKIEQFCKLNGIKEIEYVQAIHSGNTYYDFPQFNDVKSIIQVMKKREDYKQFQFYHRDTIFVLYNQKWSNSFFSLLSFDCAIKEEYIINSKKLFNKAYDWCKEHPLKKRKIKTHPLNIPKRIERHKI